MVNRFLDLRKIHGNDFLSTDCLITLDFAAVKTQNSQFFLYKFAQDFREENDGHSIESLVENIFSKSSASS